MVQMYSLELQATGDSRFRYATNTEASAWTVQLCGDNKPARSVSEGPRASFGAWFRQCFPIGESSETLVKIQSEIPR